MGCSLPSASARRSLPGRAWIAGATIGHELSVAASSKSPNSGRWRLTSLMLAEARRNLISASAVSGYTAYGQPDAAPRSSFYIMGLCYGSRGQARDV